MMASVPRIDQQVIEQAAHVLGECATGDEISRIFSDIEVVDDSPETTKWRRINTVLTQRQQRDGNATKFIEFVQKILAPVRFIGHSDVYKERCDGLNQIVAFAGLKFTEGQFIRVSPTATLTAAEQRANSLRSRLRDRNAHAEVLKYCTAELVSNDAFHAIFEACKGLFERVRQMSGVNLDGNKLVEYAFGGEKPILALNTLRTQTERDEQSGFQSLLKGCVSACRNPVAHEPRVLWSGTDEDALDLLVLISLLHKRLDRCVRTGFVKDYA